MARTREQIYNELVATKESNPELDNLLPNPDNWEQLFNFENFRLLANNVINGLSVSRIAVWRLILQSVTFAVWSLENLMDIFTANVQEIIDNQTNYGIRWYRYIAINVFQFGHDLVWNEELLRYEYETEDANARIITQANAVVSEANGKITLKVAKGQAPNLEPLSSAEETAFNNFLKGNNSSFANDGYIPSGTNIEVITANADIMKLQIDLYYNPLILNSNGELLSNTSTKPVEDAINNYLQFLPFDSTFRIIDLVDAIQQAQGVENVVLNNCDATTSGSTEFNDITVRPRENYIARAGYIRMAPGFGLDEEYEPGIDTLRYFTN